MAKVYIDRDEFYPWLIIEHGERKYGREFDVRPRIVKEYLDAQRAFEKAHTALLKAMGEV